MEDNGNKYFAELKRNLKNNYDKIHSLKKINGIFQDTSVMKKSIIHLKKLNLGCGYDIRKDFINIDSEAFHKPDIVSDIINLSNLPSNHFEYILAQDVLEHIPRALQKNALKEWSRLLCIKGQLHIRVPSIVDLVDLYKKEKSFRRAERQEYFIQMIYGTQAYPGDFHFCGYTVGTLTRLGLAQELYVSEAALKDGWLFDFTFKRMLNDSDLANKEFIVHCYCSILEQIPDQEGLNYWLGQINNNKISREYIISEFNKLRFTRKLKSDA